MRKKGSLLLALPLETCGAGGLLPPAGVVLQSSLDRPFCTCLQLKRRPHPLIPGSGRNLAECCKRNDCCIEWSSGVYPIKNDLPSIYLSTALVQLLLAFDSFFIMVKYVWHQIYHFKSSSVHIVQWHESQSHHCAAIATVHLQNVVIFPNWTIPSNFTSSSSPAVPFLLCADELDHYRLLMSCSVTSSRFIHIVAYVTI